MSAHVRLREPSSHAKPALEAVLAAAYDHCR